MTFNFLIGSTVAFCATGAYHDSFCAACAAPQPPARLLLQWRLAPDGRLESQWAAANADPHCV
jgi:hypothetical protein